MRGTTKRAVDVVTAVEDQILKRKQKVRREKADNAYGVESLYGEDDQWEETGE